MFPLAGKAFPTSADELTSAIQGALSNIFSSNEKNGAVAIAGGKYPAIKSMKIDLDGATVTATEPPPKPIAVAGHREEGITVEKLEVTGEPIQYQKTKLNLHLTGSRLSFEFGRDKRKNLLLVLTDADDGKVTAKIGKQDIQTLLLDVASTGAAQQGVTIQDLQVDLTSDGPRSVAAKVRVKAKKMMMSGVIVITGRIDVDDELNATVSNLACKGEGIVGSGAAGMLQKKIQPYDGMQIPLMAFSLGEVKLRDLKIAINNAVTISAAFGNKS